MLSTGEHEKSFITLESDSSLTQIFEKYSKTCLKRSLKKKTKIGFQEQLLLKCRSKVLQNAPRGAFCNTFDLH